MLMVAAAFTNFLHFLLSFASSSVRTPFLITLSLKRTLFLVTTFQNIFFFLKIRYNCTLSPVLVIFSSSHCAFYNSKTHSTPPSPSACTTVPSAHQVAFCFSSFSIYNCFLLHFLPLCDIYFRYFLYFVSSKFNISQFFKIFLQSMF